MEASPATRGGDIAVGHRHDILSRQRRLAAPEDEGVWDLHHGHVLRQCPHGTGRCVLHMLQKILRFKKNYTVKITLKILPAAVLSSLIINIIDKIKLLI